MNREPKISEIEKLVEHFRKTNRENELVEVLNSHNVKGPDEVMDVIDNNTHEFHNESIVINKIAWHRGLIKKSIHPFKRFAWHYKNKWYIRFGFYWLLSFVFLFSLLNAPIIVKRISGGGEYKGPQLFTTQVLVGGNESESAPLAPGEVIPNDNRIVIPKINVNSPVVFPNSNSEKVIQDALTKGVVHYFGTAKPGEAGNTFITGHSSNFWWINGNYNYIFANLDKLSTGDQVVIYYNGNKFVYTVKNTVIVLPEETSVLQPTETPTLSLMTCTPPGTNWKRLIVKLDQTSPKYIKPKIITKTSIIDSNEELPSTDNNSLGGWLKSAWEGILSIFND